MQDNTKNSYDLFEILKAHSRTSSSGVLSVQWEENDISVILNEGKIVGVDSSSNRLNKIVLDRAGLTEAEIKALPTGSIFNKTYQNLLTQNVGLLPHELEKIQRSVESEELHKLKSFNHGSFEFQLSIPDNSRSYLINLSPGQFALDLIQDGFKIAIIKPVEEQEERQEEVVISAKKDPKPLVVEKKAKESTKNDYSRSPTTRTFLRMINYHSLTPEGAKIVYFASGLFLALFCGWRMPIMFSQLLVALSELVKV